ncbi:MAG: hypothetical protein A4E19_09545 [Nitrospira sp. SG-bin1]|nr:MAG: hypothetical protein A4E19_09545 [Nitrospira sp. SG-bin1]
MNSVGLSKAGVLSVIAAAVLLAVPNGFAADASAKSGGVELKPKTIMQEKVNVKDLDEEVSHLEVVDSKGNAYLLIPLKTTGGNKPVVAEDGKIIVEYVHPYSGRLGN